MDILVLLLLSPVMFFVAQFVFKKTKISPPIFYMITGIIFGGSAGIMHIFGNQDLLPNMTTYTTMALWLMFFGAGFNIDINKIKSSGKDTISLAVLPVYIEGIIMAGIVVALLKVLPLGYELNMAEAVFIMITFASSSPANIVPVCMGLNMKGNAGKNRITDTMLTAAIFDNFSPAPAWIITLVIIAAPSMGLNMNGLQLTGVVIGALVAIAFLCFVSKIIGELIAKLLSPLSDKVAKDPTNKKLGMLYTLSYFVIIALALNFSGSLKILAVLVVVSISVGINLKEKNKLGSAVGFNASMLFAMFGGPILFSYIGSLIDLKALFNPSFLIFGLVVTILSILIKGLATKWILRDEKYTTGERNFAAACWIPKGVAVANYSLMFMGIFSMAGVDYVTEFMILLGAIATIMSLPVGITVLDKFPGKWLSNDISHEETIVENV